jgi:tetratricopeptide (TPR) repeat protein
VELARQSERAAKALAVKQRDRAEAEAKRAEDEKTRALAAKNEAEARRAEAEAARRIDLLNRQARQLNLAGQKSEALEAYQEVAGLYRNAGNREGERETLLSMAAIHFSRRDFALADEIYKSVLDQLSGRESEDLKVVTLTNLANAAVQRGRWSEATRYFDDALALAGSARSPTTGQPRADRKATILTDRGYMFLLRDDYQRALADLNRAIPLWQEAGDREGMAQALTNIGLVQLAIGDQQAALEALSEAQAIRQLESGARQKSK